MRPVRVVVVGGGIGGLSAALALRAAGAEVTVYEQAAELGEVGAGVGLYPNSMRILHRLGVADSIISHGAPIDGWWMRAPGGSVLSNQVAGRDGPIGFRCFLCARARCSIMSDFCLPTRRCVNHGQRPVIRQC